jgi:hypothetical protein
LQAFFDSFFDEFTGLAREDEIKRHAKPFALPPNSGMAMSSISSGMAGIIYKQLCHKAL